MVILIFSQSKAEDLIERTFSLGYTPIVRETIEPALITIRHEDVAGVLVDLNGNESDELEFILNVREVDEYLPVIVVNDNRNSESVELITSQDGVHFIEKYDKNFEDEIMDILEK